MSQLYSQPSDDELEVTVFGPSIGECICVHVGNSQWIVIDSCKGKSRPIAIEYFNKLGVDISSCVKLVVASHWHNDHIHGIAELFREAKQAKFWSSAAFLGPEFISLLKLDGKKTKKNRRLTEFGSVITEITKRADALRTTSAANRLDSPETVARDVLMFQGGWCGNVKAWGISPSAHDKIDALATAIKSLSPKNGEALSKTPVSDENDGSSAMFIDFDHVRVILGADLSIGADHLRGWNYAVSANCMNAMKSYIIKIPHHGSPTSHHDGLWLSAVEPSSISIVTPYTRSKLPSDSDIKYYLTKTKNLYCTSYPNAKKPESNPMQKVMDSVTTSRTSRHNRQGFVRIRGKINPNFQPTIEISDGARRMK